MTDLWGFDAEIFLCANALVATNLNYLVSIPNFRLPMWIIYAFSIIGIF